ncbi:MAG: UDP-3-O-(3-hydroxymyristoyl)glucosamine N-acyltransferase [Clostridiales bacterium]|jgi:UDP-3-O-[3-hydroxymyristoyl] glucosamine N-acyltransferase|nr:UDP-3-O-(3-hydroxymyristoyl)glucosamine N-acyltransferase [Clostridiales bacterium]
MKLSDFIIDSIELISDGTFEALDLCESTLPMNTLIFVEHEKYIPLIKANPHITCVIAVKELAGKMPDSVLGICVSSSPKVDFFLLHNRLCSEAGYTRARTRTRIGADCQISPMAHIAKENVVIGNNVYIEEFVSVKENTRIGDNVSIRSGCMIGTDGFEFKKTVSGTVFIKHAGGTVIEDNVHILNNCCVCKAVFPWDDTVVGESTVIDNLVHVAHSCKVGKRNILTAGVIFSGSAVTGDDVYIGPNAVIAKVEMGVASRASIGSVVTKGVNPGSVVSGNFAIEHSKLLRHVKELANS